MSGIIHIHGCQCGAAACINAVIEMKRHVLEQTKVCACKTRDLILDVVPARCGKCGYLLPDTVAKRECPREKTKRLYGCRACLIAVPNERGESKTIGCLRHQEWIGR